MTADICILDTSALKKSASIEMAGRSLIDWILELQSIRIPNQVLEEVKDNYRRDRFAWEKAHATAMRLEKIQEHGLCLRFVENWIAQQAKLSHLSSDLGRGEKHCAALALNYVTRRRKWHLNFTIIDDVRARNTINEFYRRNSVGIALGTPDAILLILNRCTRVTKEQALGALNDFFLANQDRKADPLKPRYVAEIGSCWRDKLAR